MSQEMNEEAGNVAMWAPVILTYAAGLGIVGLAAVAAPVVAALGVSGALVGTVATGVEVLGGALFTPLAAIGVAAKTGALDF